MNSNDTPLNVLLLMPDQHRHEWVGYVGSEWCKTPNLDRLASTGTVFTQCCTNAPICAPARCSLATGLDPHHCGVLNNNHDLDPSSPTMYRHLRDHGWWTGFVGKLDLAKGIGDDGVGADGRMPALYTWGFCDPRDSGGRMNPSSGDRRPYFRHLEAKGQLDAFDEDRRRRAPFKGVFCATRRPNVPLDQLPEDWIARTACDSLLDEDDHTDGFCGTLAERWLEDACTRSDPFFLQVNFHGPHDPYDPPVEWAELFRDAAVPSPVLPPDAPTERQERALATKHEPSIMHARRQYSAVVSMIDHRVGRILDLLEQHGKLENTLIIFASDHGDMMGDLGMFTKDKPYEGCLRVPLFIAGPGVPSGQRSDALVELSDIYPTICELIGVPVPDELDASSLMPVLQDASDGHREDVLSMLDHFVCLRTREWKYVIYADGGESLYDLVTDPGERDDLIAKDHDGELLAAARKKLAKRVGASWAGPKPDWWDRMVELTS